QYWLTARLAHTADNVQIAGDLPRGTLVVVGPYSFGAPARVLQGAAALERAGVKVAFSGDTPRNEGNSVRVTAALAVKYGLDAGAARRWMTANAAEAAGVAGRVGKIEAGMDADLVVFSGDPLRLDSRVLGVYIKGE